MSLIQKTKQKLLNHESISALEALQLFHEPIDELCAAANEIRRHFCGNIFDICTIINAKSGRCSEDCKFCAQSSHYHTACGQHPLLSEQEILDDAERNAAKGVLRYSLVTSGKTLTDNEIERICRIVEKIKSSIPIRICGSLGLLNESQYKKLYAAGLTRIHNNLETSEKNFPHMCTTHRFSDKVAALHAARSAEMALCSGGIFGIGESLQDRIDLAFSLKSLGIQSVPINLLNPVKGTPYENNIPLTNDETRSIVAVFRFILPDAFIRLAGGRGLLADKGYSCFLSGANAAISGDMLTTVGISINADLKMIKELGFEVTIKDE